MAALFFKGSTIHCFTKLSKHKHAPTSVSWANERHAMPIWVKTRQSKLGGLSEMKGIFNVGESSVFQETQQC